MERFAYEFKISFCSIGSQSCVFTARYRMLGSRTLHLSVSTSRGSYELLRRWTGGFLHTIACQQNSIRFNVNLALSPVVEGQVRKTLVCAHPIKHIASSAQLSSAQLAAEIGLPCSLHEKHDIATPVVTKRHPSMSKSRPVDGQRENKGSKSESLGLTFVWSSVARSEVVIKLKGVYGGYNMTMTVFLMVGAQTVPSISLCNTL